MRIDWTPSLQTGVDEVDRYQRDVFAAVERVARATTAPDVVLESALRRLLDAASTQFAAEERWLRGAGDPALVRHEFEHRRFLSDVAAAAEQLARGDRIAVDALDLTAFVSGWLAAHVADCDRELARAARRAAESSPDEGPGRASA
jgi:hemerythrin